MSAPTAPRGGVRGPRRPAGPRGGAGARSPGGARVPRHASAPGHDAQEAEAFEPVPAVTVAPARPDAAGEARERRRRSRARRELRERWSERRERWSELRERRSELRERRGAPREKPAGDTTKAPPGELTGLRLLLDQLDALLRDPTLALALRAFARRVATGVRTATAAAVAALKRLPRLRLRLPRRLMLGLLALLAPLVLLALLTSGDDDRAAPGAPAALEGGAALGMPALQAAPDDAPAANVALVVDGYGPAALRRELRTLGTWIAANHAAGTHVTVIDAATGRATAPLSSAELRRGVVAGGSPRATTAAIRSALARERGRRLLVTVGTPAPRSRASTLSIATRRGAGAPATVPLRRGSRAGVTIDDRRPDALAASVARALIAISGQSERR